MMSMKEPSDHELLQRFEAYLQDVIRKFVKGGKLSGMLEYHLGWRNEKLEVDGSRQKGKRGRPMLSILVYLLFADRYQEVFPAAAALELLHNSSLIFDDIQDKDEVRRSKPAVWSLWGTDEAINAGVALHTLAFRTLLGSSTRFGPHETIGNLEYISRVMELMLEGQQKELETAKNLSIPTEQDYLDIIYGKTAALFEACTYLGAAAAGAGQRDLELSGKLGFTLGMAFQIFDDMAGIWGKEGAGLDKPAADLAHRKKSYPLVLATQICGSPEERTAVSKYFANESMSEVEFGKLKAILDKTEVKQKALSLGIDYLTMAMQALRGISGRKEIKTRIADRIMQISLRQLGAVGSAGLAGEITAASLWGHET